MDEEDYCDNWLAGKGMEYLKEFPAGKPWYRGSASIPLIISGPEVKAGRESDALVMLQDLSASFMDIFRADPLEVNPVSLEY